MFIKNSKFIVILFIVILINLMLFLATYAETNSNVIKKDVIFNTGSSGGLYYVLTAGMSKVVNETIPTLNLVPSTPPSMTATPRMLSEGEAMLGMGVADMFLRAMDGIGEFEGKDYKNMSAVVGLYNNVMGYIVLKDSPIKNLKEVEGKKFSVPSQTSYAQLEALLQIIGVDPSKVKFQFMPYSQATTALTDKNIDVATFTTYPANALVEQINTIKGMRILDIDKKSLDVYKENYPYWSPGVCLSETYKGQNEDKWGPCYGTVVWASNLLDEDTVYQFLKTIFDKKNELIPIHPAFNSLSLNICREYFENGMLPRGNLHPGAVKYFKEVGMLK